MPYLHLASALLYLGGMVFIGGFLIPVARRYRDARRTLHAVARVITVVHPVLLASLGVLIMTGAVMLTDLKVALGSRYFSHLFSTLGPKLLIAFLLALLNSYQFFGLGVRLTRSLGEDADGQISVTKEQITAMPPVVGRLQWCAWTSAVLGSVAVYLGLVMGRG